MGMDWGDSLLYKAEGVPGLGEIAYSLRFAYDIMLKEPASSQPVKVQADNLEAFYQTGMQLRNELYESLLSLQQVWTGDAALDYLGPGGGAFQGACDVGAPVQGAGPTMWNQLDQLTALLDYNGTAHYRAAAKLDNLQELHKTLDEAVRDALLSLAFVLVSQAVPGEDVLADIIGGSSLGIDAARALEIAKEIVAVKDALDDLHEVMETIGNLQTLGKLLTISITDAMIGNVALLPFALPPDVSTPINGKPNFTYPPGIETDQQEITYQTLFFAYGDPLLAASLARSGLSSEEGEALVQQFGLVLVKQIAARPNADGPNTFADLFKARNIPGIQQVAQDAANGGVNGQGVGEATYELWWMANNANTIIQVQLPATGSNGKPQKGPDALLEDGTLVQLENYQWNQPSLNSEAVFTELLNQVTAMQGTYPGMPIKFIFNGVNGPLPEPVLKMLNELAGQNVSWEYWPPLKYV